jgi:hypothetical protein
MNINYENFTIDYEGRDSGHVSVIGAGATQEAAEIDARNRAARDLPYGVVSCVTVDSITINDRFAWVCAVVVAFVFDDDGYPMKPRVVGGSYLG